jgi:hypothetical protein
MKKFSKTSTIFDIVKKTTMCVLMMGSALTASGQGNIPFINGGPAGAPSGGLYIPAAPAPTAQAQSRTVFQNLGATTRYFRCTYYGTCNNNASPQFINPALPDTRIFLVGPSQIFWQNVPIGPGVKNCLYKVELMKLPPPYNAGSPVITTVYDNMGDCGVARHNLIGGPWECSASGVGFQLRFYKENTNYQYCSTPVQGGLTPIVNFQAAGYLNDYYIIVK